MLILITKDGATKVSREVKTATDLEAAFATGFCVEQVLGEGEVRPLSLEVGLALLAAENKPASTAPPADDAHVAVGSTRFSDGELQTEETLAVSKAAKPTPAVRKAAPAKTVAAKQAKKR